MAHPSSNQPIALGISMGLDAFVTLSLSIVVSFTWGYIYYSDHHIMIAILMALATMLYIKLFWSMRQQWTGMGHASKAIATLVAGSMGIGFLAGLFVTGLNVHFSLPSNLFDQQSDTPWVQSEKISFIFWSNVAMGLSILAMIGSFSSIWVRASTSDRTINAIKIVTISGAMTSLWMISFLSGRAHALGALLG